MSAAQRSMDALQLGSGRKRLHTIDRVGGGEQLHRQKGRDVVAERQQLLPAHGAMLT